MGVIYSIIPVSEFSETGDIGGIDAELYLKDSSRSPSVVELENIVSSVARLAVEWFEGHDDSKIASISQTLNDQETLRTTLVIMNVSNEEKYGYYFEKGDRGLLVDLVHRISKLCGCQVVCPDTVYSPVLVDPTLSPTEILQIWG